ncbi:MAG: methylmalonyl-CoA mutase [Planctomycetes bacterium]|nr:methylmalonyl-CoA mutase [Planctomycetota bacterium]
MSPTSKLLPERLREWLDGAYAKELGRGPRAAAVTTPSGIAVAPLYVPPLTGEPAAAFLRDVGLPGEPPYTRGVTATMYRGKLWTMRQYAGFSSARATNRRFRFLLEQGQTGLSVAFDLPTQMGFGPEDPMAAGEVGKVGVSIASLQDMEELFAGIPLEDVSTSMTINTTAIVLLAMYVALAKRRGVALERLRGTLQNDVLKEYVARGTYRYPVAPSMRLVTDILEYCAAELPRFNPISISGYHIREAGSTAVQEVAFTLLNGLEYVRAALDRGLAVDAFAPRLSFFFNAHNHLFEEVAKFRAARRIWARWLAQRFGARDPRSLRLRFHAQTAGSMLTADQPENNVVRVAMQCLAAVLGGAQSIHTNSRDEALGLPTAESAQLALRTQQVLAFESGVADTVDPLGGAPYVEALSDGVEAGVEDYAARVERLGGMIPAIEKGFVQEEIRLAAYDHQRRVESGERVVVGVNRFRVETEPEPEVFRPDPAVETEAVTRVRALRASRDGARAGAALERLAAEARGTLNLVPAVLAAVEAGVTLGEIGAVFEAAFGRYREVLTI